MSETQPYHLPAVVGSGSSVQDTSAAPTSLTIDDAYDARCSLIVDLHLSSLMKLLTEMDDRRCANTMARIAVVKLIPFMAPDEIDELIRVLARRLIETRNSKDSPSK